MPFSPGVLETLVPQLDPLVLVLNEFLEVPEWVADYSNVRTVIPDRDLKDFGKCRPEVASGDDVFLCDDEVTYSANYVTQTLRLVQDRQVLFS